MVGKFGENLGNIRKVAAKWSKSGEKRVKSD